MNVDSQLIDSIWEGYDDPLPKVDQIERIFINQLTSGKMTH